MSGSTFKLHQDSLGTVNTSGTSVTWVSGNLFFSNMVGNIISIAGVAYTVSAYTDNQHVSVSVSPGTQTGVTYTVTGLGCSGVVSDETDAGTGTHYLHLLTATPIFLDNAAGSGFPVGSTLTWRQMQGGAACNTAAYSSGGKYYKITSPGYISDGQFCLLLNVPPTASTGAYTPSVTLCADAVSTNCQAFSFSVNVVAPSSYTITHALPVSIPAIPSLSTWTVLMTTGSVASDAGGGSRWCDRTQTDPTLAVGNLNGCPDASVCYYDGTKSYFQVADYTGDITWENCARALYYFYSLSYTLPNNGSIPTNRIFPRGITMAASRPAIGHWDGRARVAASMLDNSTNVQYGFMPRVGEDRPNAYGLYQCDTMAISWQITASPYCQDLLDGVISQALFYTEPSGAAGYQTFVAGLMARSLAFHYDNVYADPRIPYVIKRLADSIWANYDQANHLFMYNTGFDLGPYCTTVAVFFQQDVGGGCRINQSQKLLNLVSPMFAWYWRFSGDDTYRVRGDDMFSSAVAQSLSPGFTGKEWAENYLWSFDYVKWRTNPSQP